MAKMLCSLEYSCEVWNINKCQAKALEFIHLHVCEYILGCSMTNCDKPVHADLGLETLKCRKDLRKLKRYRKILCMNDCRLQSPGQSLGC